MRLVIIESPYKGDTPQQVADNAAYARLCMLDCLKRGEAPFASHLLYTQVLDDGITEQRSMGIQAGLAWGTASDATVVYTDRGISQGMHIGIKRAWDEFRPVIYRHLYEGGAR